MLKKELNQNWSSLDYAILYYVWQNRTLTTRHFINKFWPGVKESEAHKYLNKFVKRQWLKRHSIPWIKEKFLYTSCRVGNKVLIEIGLILSRYSNDFPRMQNDFSESTKHDLQVTDVRIAFESSGLVDAWVSDHQLRLARRNDGITSRVPDACFIDFCISNAMMGYPLVEVSHATRRYWRRIETTATSCACSAG